MFRANMSGFNNNAMHQGQERMPQPQPRNKPVPPEVDNYYQFIVDNFLLADELAASQERNRELERQLREQEILRNRQERKKQLMADIQSYINFSRYNP